jgi:light-regulated signal transduction histidine kinase (bacteriophytochrome)
MDDHEATIALLRERISRLDAANQEVARANAHAAELMADLELRDEKILLLNDALAAANSSSADLLAELELRMADLQRTNDELRQFTYVVSHDLRAPLRAITGYAQMLMEERQASPDPKVNEFLARILQRANRMDALIVDLLAYSRAGQAELSLEPTPFDEVVSEALGALAAVVAESGATVEAPALPTLLADRRQITQLFHNLLDNAMKFRSDTPPRVRVTARHEADAWVFAVADNGIGIEPGQTERIFKVFERLPTPREYPGTGIGLAICKRVVERHGGRIWLESTPGKGTTFFFTLPGRLPPAS